NAKQHPSEHLPEVGDLVQVRSRRWLVEEVAHPEKSGQSPLVRLACADDDAQGQSLEVFWNYELDRRILEEEGWQDLAAKGFDAPRQFAAFLFFLLGLLLMAVVTNSTRITNGFELERSELWEASQRASSRCNRAENADWSKQWRVSAKCCTLHEAY